MLYFLGIILPPVAVLMVGKPIQALLNLVLTLLGWLPGVVHAFLVINSVLTHGVDSGRAGGPIRSRIARKGLCPCSFAVSVIESNAA